VKVLLHKNTNLKLEILFPLRKTNKFTFSKKTITRLKTQRIFRCRIFDLLDVKMKSPTGRKFTHHVVVHPGAAVIVPVLPGYRFVMVRQYRTAIQRNMLEFPAGTLEKGESPIHCAKREIVEETGYRGQKWTKIGSFFPASGMSTERMYLFVAEDLVRDQKVALDPDEFLEREIVAFKDLKRWILSGRILDAKTVLGFFYYCQLRKERYRNSPSINDL
jgi:ADP-ribose pyrophosphatase